MKAKLVKERLYENLSVTDHDYSEAVWKLDKFLPEDQEIQEEYYQILDDEDLSYEEKVKNLIEFFMNYADEDKMYSYFPKRGNVTDFVKHLISQNES